MKLIQVSPNEHGCYFLYQVDVQRGIKGKTKSKVKELLIVGVPFSKLDEMCKKEGIVIINKETGDKYGLY